MRRTHIAAAKPDKSGPVDGRSWPGRDHAPFASTAPIMELDRLLADAHDACLRDGVRPTRQCLSARIAKRTGVACAEISRRLRAQAPYFGVVGVAATLHPSQSRDQIALLATTILGTREREVLLARQIADLHDIAALHQLASRLGISVDRIYELEASARRKLARAAGEGP